MAFKTKEGSQWAVRHGVTGQIIARFNTEQAADDRIKIMHRKNDPERKNRGGSAGKRFETREAEDNG